MRRWLPLVLGMICLAMHAPADHAVGLVGVARIDVTPRHPVRMTGYAARKDAPAGTAQPLWAKALAFGEEHPRILITVDNCGVTSVVVDEVARRLEAEQGIPREGLAVASSHTHSGPMVRGFAENIFVRDLTPEENAAIDRYTAELTDQLVEVATKALRDRRPGRLWTAQGTVGFAANRRPQGGPVDHSLPILVATEPDGTVRAIVANYACHCTTLGHEIIRYHGDWAGFAQEFVEQDHPGAVAMITIGCGADANPSPRHGADAGIAFARRHGAALAAEVVQLVRGERREVPVDAEARLTRLELPFQSLPAREEWESRSTQPGIVGYHARKQLTRLDRGERIPEALPYVVQTWTFGEELAMVFLAGEVVVDYALRLKSEFDPRRLWVTAYANDVPCYIPSRRILEEGGYEAESSLWYYDRPARLSARTEDLVHGAVTNLLPAALRIPSDSHGG